MSCRSSFRSLPRGPQRNSEHRTALLRSPEHDAKGLRSAAIGGNPIFVSSGLGALRVGWIALDAFFRHRFRFDQLDVLALQFVMDVSDEVLHDIADECLVGRGLTLELNFSLREGGRCGEK